MQSLNSVPESSLAFKPVQSGKATNTSEEKYNYTRVTKTDSLGRKYISGEYRNFYCQLPYRSLKERKVTNPNADPAATLTTYLDSGHAFIRFEDHTTGYDEFMGFYPLGRNIDVFYTVGRMADEKCFYSKNSSYFNSKYPHHKTGLTKYQRGSLKEFLSDTQDKCDFGDMDGCTFRLIGFNCVDFAQKAHESAQLNGHFSSNVQGGNERWGKARVYGTVTSTVNPYLASVGLGIVLSKALYSVITCTWTNLKAAWRREKASDTRLSVFFTRYKEIDKNQLQLEKSMDNLLEKSPNENFSSAVIKLQIALVNVQSELLDIKNSLLDDNGYFKVKPLSGYLKLNEDKLNKVDEQLNVLHMKANELH